MHLTWQADYHDGSHLPQINNDGTKNAYADIDRDNLQAFVLFNEDKMPVFAVSFAKGDGSKLIWRRRTQMRSDGAEVIIHVVGKKHQFVALVQDGLVLLFDNYDENDALLTKPELLQGEEL